MDAFFLFGATTVLLIVSLSTAKESARQVDRLQSVIRARRANLPSQTSTQVGRAEGKRYGGGHVVVPGWFRPGFVASVTQGRASEKLASKTIQSVDLPRVLREMRARELITAARAFRDPRVEDRWTDDPRYIQDVERWAELFQDAASEQFESPSA